MLSLIKTLMAVACAVVVGFLLSAPAIADPSEDPCQLAVSFLCKFVPMAPELDGDVDLTKQVPVMDPAVAPCESRPPDICSAGASSDRHAV
jgi:hypothetical protein